MKITKTQLQKVIQEELHHDILADNLETDDRQNILETEGTSCLAS